jgi:hypothetical protein
MALLTYARGAEDGGPPLFAVVVDDKGFDYVWPRGAEPAYTPAERTELLLGGGEKPSKAGGWAQVALYNVGPYDFDDWRKVDGARKKAAREAQAVLDGEAEDPADPGQAALATAADDAWQAVSESNPGFGDDDGEGGFEATPDEMLMFVAHALGEVDPEGPNGHVIRALEGEPRPGDEEMRVSFGPPAPPDDEDEEQP